MQIYRFDFINVTKEFAMARFVQPHLATPHSTAYAAPARPATRRVPTGGSRTLAGMLMAAVLAAVMVVADQLIDGWADGHLILAWVVLWSVAFTALALLAVPLRGMASVGAEWLSQRWAAYQRQRDEDAMWEFAKGDARVMAELQAARTRQMRD